jgi:threonine dehydratase
LRETPLWKLPGSALGVGCGEVWLKLEHLQVGGSFKARGMLNRLLANPMPASGVIVASGGNAGIATAAAARALGVACEVFVPEVSPEAKRARLRDLGATVVVTGASYAEAYEACVARQRQTGALMTHAYDQSEVVAGAGTLAREIEAQGGRAPDSVLVSVGGGGLIGGVAAWFEQRCRVVALEPEGAPTLFRAREAGQPVDVAVGGIAADSLGARRIGAIAWAVTQQHVKDALLLPDDAILAAQLALESNEARSGASRRAGPGGAADRRLSAACGRNGGADSLWREPGSGEAGLSPSGSKPVRWGRSTKIGGC